MLTKAESNNAIVVRLENVRPHPNADRLKLATVVGDQVVVGLDAKDGDVMVYFDSNLRLSPEYLHNNNLYSNAEMNADPSVKGYFGKNGRVRAQKFRGEMSNGYVASISSIHVLLDSVSEAGLGDYLSVGDEFTHVYGIKVCEKYIVPTKSPGAIGSRKKRVGQPVSEMFWKHWDTKHLLREKSRLTDGLVYIEEKIHGTSARTGKVLFKVQRPWWKFWVPKVSEEWRVVSGTRRVDSIRAHLPVARKEVEEKVAPHLRCGEQLYYEIFGHSTTGTQIQNGFSYGCRAGEYRVVLYRVTITTPDGHCVDLPRDAVYRRAYELGLESPPLMGIAAYYSNHIGVDGGVFQRFGNAVWRYSHTCLTFEGLKEATKGKSTLDVGTVLEGIVVWFEDGDGGWSCLKLKSDEFLLKEDKQREKGIGDVEDNQ